MIGQTFLFNPLLFNNLRGYCNDSTRQPVSTSDILLTNIKLFRRENTYF